MLRPLLAAMVCLAFVSHSRAAEPPKPAAVSNTYSGTYSGPTDSPALERTADLAPAEHGGEHTASLLQPRIAPVEVKPTTVVSGRKHIDALLQAPAQLDFEHRDTVTVKELLDQLHERHGLSIRFDMPTLTTMFGASAVQHDSPVVATGRQTSSGARISGKPGRSASALIGNTAAARPQPWQVNRPVSKVTTVATDATADSTPPPAAIEKSKPAAALPSPLPPATKAPLAASAPPLPPSGEPVAPPAAEPVPAVPEKAPTPTDVVAQLMSTEINVGTLDLQNMSVQTALRQALESLPTGEDNGEATGLPIALTTAANFDFVVENDGVLITSRLKALTYKETRVYSVKHLKDCKPEQLALVIRQAVRPWSWRSRIDDLGEKLRVGGPRIPPKALEALFKTGVQLTGVTELSPIAMVSDPPVMAPAPCPPPPPGVVPQPASPAYPSTGAAAYAPAVAPGCPDSSACASTCQTTGPHAITAAIQPSDAGSLSAQDVAILGDALVNGLVTFVHTTITALEIAHYADPPTGTIQTLPGKLVITQSQAAHREIEELLKQLAEE